MEYTVDEIIKGVLDNFNYPKHYYHTFSKIFNITNENLTWKYKIIDFFDKDVLLPAASGAQYLAAIYYDAKNVRLYDINILTKHMTYLTIIAFKNLDHKTFKSFIYDGPTNHSLKFLNLDILKELRSELPEDTYEIWHNILKRISIYHINKIIHVEEKNRRKDLERNLPFYNEDDFINLQVKLRNKPLPEFTLTDIKDIPNLGFRNLDIIDLSNIIESKIEEGYGYIPIGEDHIAKSYDFIFITEELTNLLSKGGKILAHYESFYKTHNDLFTNFAFENMFNLYNNDNDGERISVYTKK